MNEKPQSRVGVLSRVVLFIVLPCAGVTLVYSDLLWRANLWLYDWAVTYAAPPATSEIVLVTVDKHSVDELGRWPWPRRVHAELIDRLSVAGAKVIALDVLFAEPDRLDPDGDDLLAQAIAHSARVVLPMTAEPLDSHKQLVETLPMTPLTEAAAAIGHVDIELDADGVARSVFLKSGIGEPRWPALPLAMLQVTEPDQWQHPPGERNPNVDNASPYTWIRDYHVHIPFTPSTPLFAQFSYVDVLRGQIDPANFDGRYVLVGTTTSGLGDRFTVPQDTQRRGLSGLEINAQVLASLLRRTTIAPIAVHWQWLATVLFALLPMLVYPYTPARWTPVATLALMGFAFGVTLLTLYGMRLWFPVASALCVLALSYPLWSWQQLAYAMRYLRHELARLESTTSTRSSRTRERTTELEFLARMLGANGAWLYDGQRRIIAGWGSEPALPREAMLPKGETRFGDSLWITRQCEREQLQMGLLMPSGETLNRAQTALCATLLEQVGNARILRRTQFDSLAHMHDRLQQVEQTAAHLHTAQSLISDSLQHIAGGVVIADPLGQVLFINTQAHVYLLHGTAPRQHGLSLAKLLADVTTTDAQPTWQTAASKALLQQQTTQLSARALNRDLWLQIAPYSAGEVLPAGILISIMDVTAVRQAEQQAVERIVLTEKERALATLRSIGDAVITADVHGNVESANPAAERLLACSEARVRGMPLAAAVRVFHERGGAPVTWPLHERLLTDQSVCLPGNTVLLDCDDQLHDVRVSLAPIHGQELTSAGMVLAISDISELRHMARTLEHQASHDGLTGLPNRMLLRERLAYAIAKARRSGEQIAVFFLDVDRFKHINDGLGHEAGDALLLATAQRLRTVSREQDMTARFGGDEFVMVLENLHGDDHVASIAAKILQAFAAPVALLEHEVTVSISMGVGLYPRDGTDAETLLRNADRAMYHAKGDGGNMVRFYAEDMNNRAMERLLMEHNLRRALQRGELQVHYQPQVDLHSGSMVGVEALLRWKHPDLGTIPPDVFIPLAEETGLIFPLSEWLMQTVCADINAWIRPEEPPLRVSINLSARQFSQGHVADSLAHALHSAGLEGRHLGIEITESTIMRDVDAVAKTLEKFKALGVDLAVDDFGTGYSSLSYLKRFPIDRLKIDKSFVRDITSNSDDAAIASAVIAMAHSMGRRVIAEGVETLQQLQFLRAQGCDEIQGYYFSPAVPALDVPGMFERKLAAANE